MKPSSAAAPKYKGNVYWASQLVGMAAFTVGLFAAGCFLLFAPDEVLDASGEPPERGAGVMLIFCAILFGVGFIVFFRKWRKSSAEQRAVYAWAVMQQHSVRTDLHPINPARGVTDARILGIAEDAKRGELTAAQIAQLQALRPDVPYPGWTPENPPPPTGPRLPGPPPR